jgi:hypothetical protein
MRSIWRASYELHRVEANGEQTLVGNITEANPWIKIIDGILGQSRLPDLSWLERWLDHQIWFDDQWETKVIERILHLSCNSVSRTSISKQLVTESLTAQVL